MPEQRARWATGVANVIRPTPRGVIIACPHCGLQHHHGRSMLGSRSVVAGCHAGPSRLREYRIVDLTGAGQ
jgi:hypothetical protein